MSEVKWTNEQLQAINEKGNNILVAAAAGSGKTAVLVERIINKVINEKIDIDKILVVTFTNAAASEMRERILEAIYKKLEENPLNYHLQRQIILLNKASISTIHSFCLDIIRNNFYEVDASANFRIADTAENDLLKYDVLDDLFEEKYNNNDKDFLNLIEVYTDYRSDDKLKELILNIYKFIQSSPFPEKWIEEKVNQFKGDENKDFSETIWGQVILSTLKDKIEEAVIKLRKISSETSKFIELSKFTAVLNEDIINLEFIMSNMNLWNSTFNSINSFKWKNWPVDKKVTLELKDKAKEVRDKVKKELKSEFDKYMIYNSEEALKYINNMYYILNSLKELVKEFSKKFSERKKEKNIIDFNDIEHLALKILLKEENGEYVESDVAKKYKEKFEEIAIDEYQDSNLVQEYILNSISKNNNIFMVGDVKQSIYKFRQARPELFLDKYEKYSLKAEQKENENLKIQLFKNFRSRKNILDITNLVFKNIMSKKIGDIEYNENEYLNYGANYPEPEENNFKYAGKAELHIIDLKENDEISAYKDEIEVEEDDEQERVEDDVIEAKFVAKKIQEIMNSGYKVYDRKEGYRNIKYKDIVILLRATSTLAPIFEKELADLDLPVFSDSSAEYLNSVEIQTIMSILKIIDNPLQDIPLVTVLRSTIGKFTDNDLIEIRLVDRNCDFYEALLKARISAEGNLKNKIEDILSKLEKWREEQEYKTLDELIWQIYIDTGYYNYVGLLPNGALRQANLKILFEKAKQYESASFKGLFNFINFIDKLKGNNGDMASAKLIGENEDVIRIMSIHKSKGLEFPIVFLCVAQKSFNMKDLNENILLHQDMGFGPTFIDIENKIKFNTLAKEAIKIKSKEEIISEEERILYVALTRAKEKLIITGRKKDLHKDLAKKQEELELYTQDKESIDNKLVKKAKSYLDWIMLVYLFNKNNIKDIMELYEHNKNDLIKEIINKEETADNINLINVIEEEAGKLKNEEEIENISKELNWKYKYQDETTIPTKTSVTKIKELKNENVIDIGDILNDNKEIKLEAEANFIKQEEKISSSKKGSLVHLCLQRIDERQDYNIEDLKKLVQGLVFNEIITEKEAESIDVNILYKYVKSELFEELRQAKKIYKEQPFYINVPVKELYKDVGDTQEKILVQGIIDLFFINNKDELVLIDYKTDYVEKGKESVIKERYKVQLELYKNALEKSFNKKVSRAQIYLAQLRKFDIN